MSNVLYKLLHKCIRMHLNLRTVLIYLLGRKLMALTMNFKAAVIDFLVTWRWQNKSQPWLIITPINTLFLALFWSPPTLGKMCCFLKHSHEMFDFLYQLVTNLYITPKHVCATFRLRHSGWCSQFHYRHIVARFRSVPEAEAAPSRSSQAGIRYRNGVENLVNFENKTACADSGSCVTSQNGQKTNHLTM